jgi:hypothetical protein
MNASQFRAYVILPALKPLGLWSMAAETLLVATMAHESQMGKYLHQIKGPALGVFQIEPLTHFDIWANYLKYKKELRDSILGMVPSNMLRHDSMTGIEYGAETLLITDLAYATVMARLVYLRAPGALPAQDDIDGLADYWKQYYNTPAGAGTVEQFKAHYSKYAEETIT